MITKEIEINSEDTTIIITTYEDGSEIIVEK
jgi:hypothetical protein